MTQQDHPTHSQHPRQFDHHRLDAWHVAKQALLLGHRILQDLPRGYGRLKDQAVRALCSSFCLVSEATGRTGADHAYRMRMARSEANEAAAIFEVVGDMQLAPSDKIEQELELLWRLSAMATGLARARRR